MKNPVQFALFLLVVFVNSFIDLGQKITLLNIVNASFSGATQVMWTGVIGVLIVLPSVLLITPSGFLADRFSKARVTQWVIGATVPLSVLAWLGFKMGWFPFSVGMMFLYAIQSVFYTPVRNAHIKELVGLDDLAKANGWVQSVMVLSILTSAIVYAAMFQMTVDQSVATTAALLPQVQWIGGVLIGLSILQTAVTLALQSGPAGWVEPFDWGRYLRLGYLKDTMAKVWGNQVIWLSSVGLGLFFGVNQVLLSIFAAHVQAVTGVTNAIIIQSLPACAGVGIIVGALYSGRVSRHYIETGVLPIGAIGATTCLAVIPTLQSIWTLGAAIFLFGVCCGIYIVPLTALIQYYSGDQEIGKIAAADSFVQNTIMTVFLGVSIGLSAVHVPIVAIVWLLVAVGVAGTAYLLIKVPQFFVRFLLRFIATVRYRYQVTGMHHIPAEGPVLMLGNHTSFLDWALLQVACPRPIRFVMSRDIYLHWSIKWFLDIVNVIPISSTGSKDSIRAIKSALENGDLVVLFPEGHLSRTGQLAKFHKGYELAVRSTNATIIPFYLKGLWGSHYSYATQRFKENLRGLGPRRVDIRFGEPLPPTTVSAVLKQRISELSIQAWETYSAELGTIQGEWLKVAKRVPGRLAVADSSGIALSHRALYVAARAVSRALRQDHQSAVGIILPSGAPGVIANLGTLLAGKTVVNLNFTASQSTIETCIQNAQVTTIITSRRMIEKLSERNMDLTDVLSTHHVIWMEDLLKTLSLGQKVLGLVLFTCLPIRFLHGSLRHRSTDSVAAILFSSGSEGTPKGVLLTHQNIVGNIKQTTTVINPVEDDVMVASLPLFHAFGLTVTTFLPLLEGIPIVAHPDPTDGFAVGKLVARFKGTILFGTSTFFRLYIRNKKVLPIMFQSIRLMFSGAEKLSPQVRTEFKEKFGVSLLEGYGTTETTPVATVNIPDTLDTELWWIQEGQKPGSVGLPVPGTTIRVVDPVDDTPLPIGESGRILIGGPQIMAGYLNDPEKTAQVVRKIDGIRWYDTGDKGRLDEDGFLFIEDRFSRFAKIAGEMVSLTSVESQLALLLDGDIDFAATAVPDDKKGEAIVLVIAGGCDLDAVTARINGSDMIPLVRPSHIVSVPAIPKLGSGKLDLSALKAIAMDSLNR